MVVNPARHGKHGWNTVVASSWETMDYNYYCGACTLFFVVSCERARDMDLAGLCVSKHKQERKDTFSPSLSLPHTFGPLFLFVNSFFSLLLHTHTQGHARTHNGHSVDPLADGRRGGNRITPEK